MNQFLLIYLIKCIAQYKITNKQKRVYSLIFFFIKIKRDLINLFIEPEKNSNSSSKRFKHVHHSIVLE